MGSVEDILQLCRLCLVKDQVNIPIFDESSDIRQTFLKISSCLPVKVTREDNLPKRICDECSYKLDMLYIFRNTSSSSEKQLLTWLDQVGLTATAPHTAVSSVTITKPEIQVKQETFDSTEIRHNEEVDAQDYLMQQPDISYQQNFVAFGESSQTDEGPPPKRVKRAAALKQTVQTAEESDEEDMQAALAITKAEGESDDSDEMDEPDYVEAPSTSADDQPGPSGVGKDPIEAPYCNKEPIELEELILIYEGRERRCTRCPATFSTLHELKKHSSNHRPTHRCTLCSFVFPTGHQLRGHMKGHVKGKHVCEICKKFISDLMWETHKLQHEGNGKIQCPECDRVFNFVTGYKRHQKVDHSNFRFTCDLCNKPYRTMNALKHHKRVNHLNMKLEYHCTFCDKRFTSYVGLDSHIKSIHEGIKFVCEFCGMSMTSKAGLHRHIAVQHKQSDSFLCDFCDKKFPAVSYLKSHLKIHTRTDRTPYSCQYCDKKYASRSAWSRHIKVEHTGERPHVCDVCSKCFVDKHRLRKHYKIHVKGCNTDNEVNIQEVSVSS